MRLHGGLARPLAGRDPHWEMEALLASASSCSHSICEPLLLHNLLARSRAFLLPQARTLSPASPFPAAAAAPLPLLATSGESMALAGAFILRLLPAPPARPLPLLREGALHSHYRHALLTPHEECRRMASPRRDTKRLTKESSQAGPWLQRHVHGHRSFPPQGAQKHTLHTQTRERTQAHMRKNSGEVVSRGNRMQGSRIRFDARASNVSLLIMYATTASSLCTPTPTPPPPSPSLTPTPAAFFAICANLCTSALPAPVDPTDPAGCLGHKRTSRLLLHGPWEAERGHRVARAKMVSW